MKKECITLGILIIFLLIYLMVPYIESARLCRDIESGDTEKALKRIERMWDVNCSTCPVWMKEFLIRLEYMITTPLITACEQGNYQVAEVLLKKVRILINIIREDLRRWRRSSKRVRSVI